MTKTQEVLKSIDIKHNAVLTRLRAVQEMQMQLETEKKVLSSLEENLRVTRNVFIDDKHGYLEHIL